MLGSAVHSLDRALGIEGESELGRDDDAVPGAFQLVERPRKELLVREWSISFRGIEERHPELYGRVDRGDRRSVVAFVRGAIRVAHSHQAEPERRNSEALRAECFFFFQAEDGIRDYKVTGVQTCALPI